MKLTKKEYDELCKMIFELENKRLDYHCLQNESTWKDYYKVKTAITDLLSKSIQFEEE